MGACGDGGMHASEGAEGEAGGARAVEGGTDDAIADSGESCSTGSDAHFCSWVAPLGACTWFLHLGLRMTRGKQKIEAQKRAAERNEKPKGSQIEARSAGLKTVCSICKAPLANHKQLVDHFASKHPKEEVPPAPSS